MKIWAGPELFAGACVLVLLKADGQSGQVLALNGCPKEADDSGKQEPDLAKPEGRASYCFPWAGLGSRPRSHPLIPAMGCHAGQVSYISEGKGGFLERGYAPGSCASVVEYQCMNQEVMV